MHFEVIHDNYIPSFCSGSDLRVATGLILLVNVPLVPIYTAFDGVVIKLDAKDG